MGGGRSTAYMVKIHSLYRWYAKSFSCLTQLKVMLGWVELWLSLGFDKKLIIVFYKTFHVALDVPWIFKTFMLPWHPTSTDSTCCIWCSLFPMFNLSKVFEIINNDTPIEKWPYYLLMEVYWFKYVGSPATWLVLLANIIVII